mmetsp:Transcript_43936/g.131712  ORF Transcript_43936/g.131712 Transcript_43936/m.131712 type:complete len:475 (-) Transcript_43936:3021-4445(-)
MHRASCACLTYMLHPRHPPDVHAAELLLVGRLANEALRLALHRERHARLTQHTQQRAAQPALDRRKRVLGRGVLHLCRIQAARLGLCPVDERIVQKCFGTRHEHVLVLPQDLQRDLSALAEHALHTGHAKRVHDVLRQTERHHLRHLQHQTLVEKAAKVDVHGVATCGVDQHILSVAVAQAQHVSHHTPHRVGACEVEARLQPRGRPRELCQEPSVHARRQLHQHSVQQLRAAVAFRPGVIQLLGAHGEFAALVEALCNVNFLTRRLERVQVVDPLQDAAVLRQRQHRVRPHAEVAPAARGVLVEQAVEHGCKVHEPVVLSQVVFRLGQERVELAVRATEGDLLGLLEARHHQDIVLEGCQRHQARAWIGRRCAGCSGHWRHRADKRVLHRHHDLHWQQLNERSKLLRRRNDFDRLALLRRRPMAQLDEVLRQLCKLVEQSARCLGCALALRSGDDVAGGGTARGHLRLAYSRE